MRNLGVVVDRLMAIIPEEETALRRRLRAAAADRWKPPEQLWRMGAEAFYDRFGDEPPTDGWGRQALDIWMGVNAEDETDGLGGAVVVESVNETYKGYLELLAAVVVLVLLGVAVWWKT